MRIEREIQAVIEEKRPELIPFLRFIESTKEKPVEAKGARVSYNDSDLTTVVLAVYLYALHGDPNVTEVER